MKVLLCDMPVSDEDKFGSLKQAGSSSPPLNLLFLGSALKKSGHEVKITLDDASWPQVAETIKSFEPGIIGVTFMTIGSASLPKFVELVRLAAPKSILIAGGYHSTLYPREVLDAGNITAVFRGEAENNLPKFIEMCVNGPPDCNELKTIPGIAYLDHGEMIDTGPAEIVSDLDTLPFPDYSLIPSFFEKFHGSINRHYLPNPQAFLLTSRGCPFSCHFCGRQILGQRVRSNSADYILDLLEFLKKKYFIKSAIYADEFFTLDKRRTEYFCNELRTKGLNKISWSCSGRTNNMTQDMATTLKQGGCKQISYGIESGSPAILKMLNKKSTLTDNANAVLFAHRAGLETYGSIILGSPGETRDTLKETRDFVLNYPLSFIGLLFFTPLPGSYFYENARYKQYGEIIDTDLTHYNCFDGLPFVATGLSAEFLRAFRTKLYKDFYLRPKRLIRELKYFGNWNSWKTMFRLIKSSF
ncbi:B12-binding domain-containing radical SAM protein [Desulfovibrio sp. OttesenSCG-928-G11]|nr:B12-binding domain-containing radical SAM protein [Desulfovibrio sp. OttesenSCG-928-G11]